MEKTKTVYIVTRGPVCLGSNPPMTREGLDKVKELKRFLPAKIPLVVCGTGVRHIGVRQALGLENVETKWSALVGGPEVIQGDEVILASCHTIPVANWITVLYGTPSMMDLLYYMPQDTVFCAGIQCLRILGKPKIQEATVYRVWFTGIPNLKDIKIKTLEDSGPCEVGD